MQDEADLLRRARDNPEAFAPIYERYVDRVYAYCRRRVDDPQEAEDLCSLVFARALGGLGGYRGGNVAAWLFQIAHNTVVKHYRARRTQAPLDETSWVEEGGDDPLEQQDAQAVISGLVRQLTDDQRAVLALMIDGDMTSQQAGMILGRSAGSVRVQLHRILERLRQQYQRVTGERAP